MLEPRFGNRRSFARTHRDAARRQALARKGRTIAYECDRMKSKARHVSTRDRARPALLIAYCALLSTSMRREREDAATTPLREEIPRERRANGRESSYFYFYYFFFTLRVPLENSPLPTSSLRVIDYLPWRLCRRNRDGTCLRQIEFSIAPQFSKRLLIVRGNERNLQLSCFINLEQVCLEEIMQTGALTDPRHITVSLHWSPF